MRQGPPQTPPIPEQVEFKVLHPGDEHVTTSLTGHPICITLTQKDRIITAGKNTALVLGDFNDYFFVAGIYVNEALRKQGIGSKLYDEALKLARSEGKKGLLSSVATRNDASKKMWQRFQQEGRTSTVTIDGGKYDVLLC